MDKKLLEEGDILQLQFQKRGGKLPTIVQEDHSNEVLMLGYVSEEALRQTLDSGYATFWSTSRNTIWRKGETSGDYLKISEIWVDCDQDALIFKVKLLGAGACHTKDETGNTRKSCFYRYINDKNTLKK